MQRTARRFDWVLVGGGLANGLIAAALLHRFPAACVAWIEREPTIGGNHTWCFHELDLPPSVVDIVAPMVAHRWPGYEVRFPGRRRFVASPYAAVTSESFAEHLLDRFSRHEGAELLTGTEAIEVTLDSVTLADGRRLAGARVIDARGPERVAVDDDGSTYAYQKFVGIEVELTRPHGRSAPCLIDALVPQDEGFRFVYTLPLGDRRLLVEDTYYSRSSKLNVEAVQARVLAYVRMEGFEVARIARVERGILPLPMRDLPQFSTSEAFRAGYAGGWIHPTTGYSFPIAARVADFLSAPKSDALAPNRIQDFRRQHERQTRFCLMLNRLLFGAFAPEKQFHVLERFYGLPADTIARFYALATSPSDRARILCGRPPRGFSVTRLLSGGIEQ